MAVRMDYPPVHTHKPNYNLHFEAHSFNKQDYTFYLCRSCHAFVIQAFPISVLVILGKFS